MEFGIFLLIIIVILYFLLVQGYLWKMLIAGFGFYGMYLFLTKNKSNEKNNGDVGCFCMLCFIIL